MQADGSIKREVEGATDDESWLEVDGSYIRIAPEMEISISGQRPPSDNGRERPS